MNTQDAGPGTFTAPVFLLPPLAWWMLLTFSLLGLKPIEQLLVKLQGAGEVAVLLVCPLIAAVLAAISLRRGMTADRRSKLLSVVTLAAGIFLAACAVLASLRKS
jgi:Sec-independent protein secretion pathway component TatC